MKNTINSSPLMSTRDAYGQVLVEIGKEHKNIVVLNADLSQSTSLPSRSILSLPQRMPPTNENDGKRFFSPLLGRPTMMKEVETILRYK
jgi:transketolase